MTHIAVITGSSKGIGFGYATELLRRGNKVVISGRSPEELQRAREALEQEVPDSGNRITTVSCDVADLAQVQNLWDEACRAHGGPVSLWINNAGFARSGPTLEELTPEEIELMTRSNLIGTIHGCDVAVRGMLANGQGYIVNTLGGGAKGQVVKGMIAYSTTKRAVKYITECLRKELKGKGIRVSTVSPGVNVTEGMLREIAALPPEQREKTIKPLNIIGDHVETTTPWLIDQLLAAGGDVDVSWLTGGKLMKRFLMAPFSKRDLLARYDL